MTNNYVDQVMNYFRNITLNSIGAERDLLQHIMDGDINYVLELMEDNEQEVDKALREYNVQTHKVMKRADKFLEGGDIYHTEKLPRTRARYINEVELFFLLGKPIKWKKEDGEDEAYQMFLDFLKDTHFDANMRKCKRLAGAETESAKLYRIYREKGEPRVSSVVLARTTGYKLRPLFDQYGTLIAFAYGYKLREGKRTVQHWDIETPDMLFYCTKRAVGWDVESYQNPTGKINLLYYRQLKSWDGVSGRIEREEDLDSKVADTNNYFADPIAAATADVIDSMVDPNKPGKLIQLTGSGSRFEYINPPQSSTTRESERVNLERSILFDTFTPDLSYENLKGLGSLSGVAIMNAMQIGRIKAENRKETYGPMVVREVNLIKAILKYLHPDKEKMIDDLQVSFEFSEPFEEDASAKWQPIVNLHTGGLASLETCVKMLSLTEAPEEEVDRIRMEQAEALATQMQLAEEAEEVKQKAKEAQQ